MPSSGRSRACRFPNRTPRRHEEHDDVQQHAEDHVARARVLPDQDAEEVGRDADQARLGPEGAARATVVVATSDEPALLRLRAAVTATRL